MKAEFLDRGIDLTKVCYFGGCPVCGGDDGYMNVGRSHWLVCKEHKTKWHVGDNLFSCWKDEDDAVWQANQETLENYEDVRPIHCPAEAQPSNPSVETMIANALREIADRLHHVGDVLEGRNPRPPLPF